MADKPSKPDTGADRPPGGIPPLNPDVIALGTRALEPLRAYHQHKVVGIENIPLEGPLILVVNHSLATYDGFFLGMAITEERGREPYGLADNLIFKIPGLKQFARAIGLVPASPAAGEALLKEGRMLAVAPGGMREALRPSDERHRVRWDKRKGFIRLAIRSQAPIVLGACPRADEIYHVFENPLTKLAYSRLKIPLPIALGRGPTVIPRAIPLTHYLAPPLQPPPYNEATFTKDVDAFHGEVVSAMNDLMDHAIAQE